MGVVSGAMQAGSNIAATAMTNNANKQIAQMNNAFNEKMLNKQMDYNKDMYTTQVGDQWKFYNDAKQNSWDMYNAQNEYNSASAQRERLEAAGLNPYMMMSGGSAGVAQGSTVGASGAPSAQGITPPTATPYSADYSGIAEGLGAAINTVMQLKNSSAERDVKNAEANNLRIEGKYKAAKMIAEINDLKTNARTKAEQMQLNKLIASFDNDLKISQMEVNNEKIGLLRTQTRLTATQDVMLNTQLNFLSQEKKMQLALGAADLALKRSQNQLTGKQVEHEVQKIAETIARTSLTNQQYWTERANTVNSQLESTRRQIENQYNSETYRNRVKLIEEQLIHAINNSSPDNPVKALLGLGRGVRRVFGGD